ncbi:hypothetical protein FACS18949_10480 [Clostridia bacterium]|nr:hypothetical protein FACS18949_10480 [Clostridia bacterium]
MSMLIIAEKPSVSREIAAVLGANQKRDGYIEGTGYIVSWCFQNAVVQVATSNYNGTYQGQRQGYSGGYDKADPAAAWTEALNRGDIQNALNSLLVAGNDYTIDSVDVTAANATFARTAGNISRVEIAATMTVQLYYHAGNLASVPITLNIRVRSGYTQKF